MITAYTDGGARGNPGPAGYGVHILDGDDNTLAELVGPLGHATNNVAEYSGLIAALQWAVDHGHRRVRVRMDSELVIKQMRGEYKVKHATMQELHADAKRLIAKLERVTFEHVRREQNKVADGLSNQAMDIVEGKPPAEAPAAAAPAEPALLAPRAISIPRPPKPEQAGKGGRPSAPRFDFDLE
ncbi:14.7 kDa ribonuclease H-like protein [Luteitalea pratensis]|uniref:14.7 kDa ribonuclease H-like protein n=1 Tax=Luteitalea pratensis TaxID=1855912 RepID=A0A143PV35_LUTPR|nr:ribonuclease HI family protein [Luteitalea pratensis]AMY12617.1 14.7 kDa ribonuclease H-like protein [Luteitalea pratensis]